MVVAAKEVTPLIVTVLVAVAAVKVPGAGVNPGKYVAQPVLLAVWPELATDPPAVTKVPLPKFTAIVVAPDATVLKPIATSCASLAIIGLALPVVPISRRLDCVKLLAKAFGKTERLATKRTAITIAACSNLNFFLNTFFIFKLQSLSPYNNGKTD